MEEKQIDVMVADASHDEEQVLQNVHTSIWQQR